MEREKLHRFFSGKTSVEEGMNIRLWMDASEENRCTFYKERRLFDALMLHDDRNAMKKISARRPPRIIHQWLKVSAIVILTLAFNYLYQEYKSSKEVVAMNTVSVPAGQRTNIILPDGTNVWLNARTTLRYPVTFNKKQRIVFLKGEAYFDVTKNKKTPFVVQTDKYDIEVLGTQFNVSAYPNRNIFETTLMKGRVRVISQESPEQTIILSPGHKAYVTNGELKIDKVNDFNPYRWKEGLICFKDELFQTIMEKFEQYYDIRIIINNPNALKYSYTGKFRQSDGIDYALRVLQRDIQFKYEKDNDEGIIYIN
ncbi:FecR family protein [Bacteroides heparinolyticus]|uniref:FecR family protein n=1 Tax=Prevotella heparinolytica TaxID=28113 RepID=UPI00359F60D4